MKVLMLLITLYQKRTLSNHAVAIQKSFGGPYLCLKVVRLVRFELTASASVEYTQLGRCILQAFQNMTLSSNTDIPVLFEQLAS